MAEDRFANVFTAEVIQSAANVLTFAELNFGITLRDRTAIVIDQLYWFPAVGTIFLMTDEADDITMALCVSDQITDINDMGDRRILAAQSILATGFGTPASAALYILPLKDNFAPPLIVLPNRIFIAVNSTGLATAATVRLRMHFRTVSITQDQQLIEVLESFQLST